MRISHRGAREADAVFRRYARLGLDRRNISPFEAYDCMRGVCRTDDEARELLAVYDMLRILVASGKRDCARAVREVYFFGAGRRPRRNESAQLAQTRRRRSDEVFQLLSGAEHLSGK